MDLYQLINFASPGIFGTAETFRKKYSKFIEIGNNVDASIEERRGKAMVCHEIYQNSSAVIHRRNIEIIKEDLPKKEEFIVKCCLQDFQVQLYKAFLRALPTEKRSELSANHQLNRICCHPNVVGNYLRGKSNDTEDLSWYDNSIKKFKEKIVRNDVDHGSKVKLLIEVIRQCEELGEKL
uniref:SNF2 N-terminal domain-containing protein n=1 Tax=Panagrolaimus superbus TaxID=310955 RepID=A0A914Y6L9_9BILA